MSNNAVILIGRTGQAPELKTVNKDEVCIRFSIAVNRGKDMTDWVPCELWGKKAERFAEFVKKGALVSVTGRLRIDKWTKDGKEQQRMYVRCTDFQSLEPKAKGSDSAPYNPPSSSYGSAKTSPAR